MTRTLLCYGDSNTHGTIPMTEPGGLRRYAPDDRWTTHLARALDGWRLIDEGLPARTTVHDDPIEGAFRNGLAVLPAILASHCPIDVVMIMLGTNDLKQRFGVSAADIALSVERLGQAVEASDAGPDGEAPELLIVAPPPIRETGVLGAIFAGGAEESRLLGQQMSLMAARHDWPFVDAGTFIEVSEVDGIHYEAAMAPRLASALEKAIRHHFPA